MTKFFKTPNTILRNVTNFLLLHLAYLLGIGISSLVAKLVGKRFLEMSPKGSTWKKHRDRGGLETMY